MFRYLHSRSIAKAFCITLGLLAVTAIACGVAYFQGDSQLLDSSTGDFQDIAGLVLIENLIG